MKFTAVTKATFTDVRGWLVVDAYNELIDVRGFLSVAWFFEGHDVTDRVNEFFENRVSDAPDAQMPADEIGADIPVDTAIQMQIASA